MSTRLLHGDCRELLKSLPSESVHCVVTSPPYFGLRDYGTGQWEGGDPDCDHTSTRRGHGDEKQATSAGTSRDTLAGASHCRLCDATRTDSQIGLEATPDAYVAEIVAVFREVRRVLRNDGTLWLNLGDSYAGSAQSGQNNLGASQASTRGGAVKIDGERFSLPIRRGNGLKPKDLIGIPWMVAFALRADGWYLRQDIIWSKPNPMPESVRDRCTKAHEIIFLMSKSPRYFWDAEAIREPHTDARVVDGKYVGSGINRDDYVPQTQGFHGGGGGIKMVNREYNPAGRNKRSVWEVATAPFSEAHFATFPPALIEPCILAGCPRDGVVLDPFAGAGTTGLVADRLGRNAILIELNASYADMSKRRIVDDLPLFAEVVAA